MFAPVDASLNALANQFLLKFGHRSQELRSEPARGRREVEVVPQTHECNAERSELSECHDQEFERAREAIQFPDQKDVEPVPPCVRQKPEFWE